MPTKEQKILLESKTKQYQANIQQAYEYLKGRGFTEETIASARLGVVDEPIEGDTYAAGQRLSIPYITQSGIVKLRFRCLRGHDHHETSCPKYLDGPGANPRIYGVGRVVSAGTRICVVEGELDALTLGQLGYAGAGIPGANAWCSHWSRCFEDFSTSYVFGDGDDAGRKFASQVVTKVPGPRKVMMPEGEDVNSMYQKEGREYFDRLLR